MTLAFFEKKDKVTITNYYLRKYTIYYNFSPVHAFKLIFANCNLKKKMKYDFLCPTPEIVTCALVKYNKSGSSIDQCPVLFPL